MMKHSKTELDTHFLERILAGKQSLTTSCKLKLMHVWIITTILPWVCCCCAYMPMSIRAKGLSGEPCGSKTLQFNLDGKSKGQMEKDYEHMVSLCHRWVNACICRKQAAVYRCPRGKMWIHWPDWSLIK